MASGAADPVLRSRAETTRNTIFVTLRTALERDRTHVAHEDLKRATRFAQEIVVWFFFFQIMGAESHEEPAVDFDAVAQEARRASVVYLTRPFDYLGTDARGTDHD
jgi:hypothetical protein